MAVCTISLTRLGSLQVVSALTLVRNVVLEITGILAIRLVRVEHQAVRTQGPPGLTPLTGPVLVALIYVFEDEALIRQLGEGWTPDIEGNIVIL